MYGARGEALWAIPFGNASSVYIENDNDGNVIAVGDFTGTIPGTNLTNAGSFGDVFVAKFSSLTGNLIWARQFSGSDLDYTTSVAVDDENNIYVAGLFRGTVHFENTSYEVGPYGDAFVFKLDTNGVIAWLQRFDGTQGSSMIINVRNDVVAVAGTFTGTVAFGSNTFTNSGLLLATLSAASGTPIWARSFDRPESASPRSIAIDSSGNIVLPGFFAGNLNFGGSTLSTSGSPNYDVFLAKFSSLGAHLLSRQFGGPMADTNTGVAIDSNDNIVITGGFRGTVEFGCPNKVVSAAADNMDVYVAKYSLAGACLWAKGYGGAGILHEGTDVTVSHDGSVGVTGYFCDSISFDGRTFTSASGCPKMDAFLLRLDAEGRHLASTRDGGLGSDGAQGVAESSDGRLFVIGSFEQFTEYGGRMIAADAPVSAFIAGRAPF